MAYSLHLREAEVVDYLRECAGLSREGRIILYANIHADLREKADFYRSDQDRRLAPGSPYFWYDIVFLDPRNQHFHRFWFVVSDAAATYGVLQSVYAEEAEPLR